MSSNERCVFVDPICGKHLSSNSIWATYAYLGQEYNFCCSKCLDTFLRRPGFYMSRVNLDDREYCAMRFRYRRMVRAGLLPGR